MLKDNDGQLKHDTLLTKAALLKKVCELIPKLQTRTENPDGINHEDEEEKVAKEITEDATEPAKAESKPAAAPAPTDAGSKAEKKKNKNKNKKKNKW